ncbi:MAG: phospho-2-dehydro-3-deoxyheptonate aldolase, partial [Burkholderiales bacterium PBB5]
HDRDQALHYAQLLKRQADALAGELLVVMRVYFEKPRTTVGWKGLINDPRLDGSFRINEGLRLAREILLAVNALGLPAGTEFLDLLGFKNGTDGGVQVAADAIVSAAAPHSFMGMTKMGVAAIFETRGNADGHIILRGGKQPNYDAASVEAACAVLRKAGLREQVMIDCSHANSAAGEHRITGVMVESHLHEGRQDLKPGVALQPGVSITDACIGWDDTVPVLQALAEGVRARRARG